MARIKYCGPACRRSAKAVVAPITADRLRELLSYDPQTGVFLWRSGTGSFRTALAGNVAGHVKPKDGYQYIRIDGAGYLGHRLAWLYVHSVWPAGMLDHENTNRADNRIANLRPATNSQNLANSRTRIDSPSGLKGATREKGSRWRAQVRKDGHTYFLGTFDTAEEAHAAYCAKARELHGAYARTA